MLIADRIWVQPPIPGNRGIRGFILAFPGLPCPSEISRRLGANLLLLLGGMSGLSVVL
jgi:hypothetical protein